MLPKSSSWMSAGFLVSPFRRRDPCAYGEPGDFRDAAPRHFGRVDDAAVERCGTGTFEGQRRIGIVRIGQHEACAADQGVWLVYTAQQAMEALGIVSIDLPPVGTFRLELELFAIDFVADAVNLVAERFIVCSIDAEVFPEAVAEIDAVEE